MSTDTVHVEIPMEVRDNSETVIDYAFMRHRAQSDYPYHTVAARDTEVARVDMFPELGLSRYVWTDVNPETGQRCRFDMIVNSDGVVVNLYHTEYFTRVACYQGDWCSGRSYATHYVVTVDGSGNTSDPVPMCDGDRRAIEGSFTDSPVTVHLSERLRIGQH